MLSDISIEESLHPTNAKPFDVSITKSVLSVILVSILIFFLFGRMAKNYKSSPLPKGFGKFVEPIIIFVRDEIAIPNIGEKYYSRYMSYLLTVFFFIWFINLTGLTPFGINVTGNIAVTSALAIMTFLITNFSGKKDYWKHIFWMPGVPTPMKFVLAPIELLGVIIKPFALLIRLYANISAGHIVLMSLIGLLFVFQNWFARGAFLGLTVFLSLIELLVAFLQAYIFTMLTALYFGMAVEEHDHEHAH
jgi:F-type H+-transporting ATPase subunit a